MLFLRFSSNVTPRIFLATASSLPLMCLSSARVRASCSGGGRIHMRLHGPLGGDEPFGDGSFELFEAQAWHRHRNCDGVAQWIAQAHPRGADAERVLFAIEGDA